MNKKIVIICLICCIIFTLSAVSATDVDISDTNETLTISENDIVQESNDISLNAVSNDDVLRDGEGTFSELYSLISSQESGATLTLNKNYTYSGSDSFPNGISITKDITIVADGKIVIDASQKSRIFYINGAVVSLKGITFVNAKLTSASGAVYSNSKLTVDNCNFTNNEMNTGGAIYVSGRDSVINNSYFNGNSATFSGNSNGGGAILIYRDAIGTTISNCKFEENYAINNGHGGAICSQSSNQLLIDNCTFKSNCAGSGGSIYMETPSNLRILNSTFEKNYVNGQFGGAIHFQSGNGVTIDNCTFEENRGQRGGAIRCDNQGNYYSIYNTRFIDNFANYEGGGFSHNQPAYYTHMENCTFINCSTEKRSGAWGGGLHTNSYYSQFRNITFINCSSQDGGSWDIKWSQNNKFYDIKIINSSAARYGGSVMIWDSNSVFANATIINSTSDVDGGAIAWTYESSGNPTSGTLTNIKIINASAKYSGGAIYWNSQSGRLTNVSITNAHASNGGGLYLASSDNQLKDFIFTDNSAAGNGGAIYINQNYQTMTNFTFNGNNATGYGGAVYVGNNIYIYFHNSTFNDSHAYNGGGLYYAGSVGSLLWLHNCTLTDNTASHNGGAIYYVIDDDENNPIIYRDYNNFDGQGVITDGRTSVTLTDADGSTYAKRIDVSYFKDNKDYILNMTVAPDEHTLMAIVNVSSPNDPNKNKFRIVVNITKDNVLVTQLILNTIADYNTYFNTNFEKFIMNIRNNLTKNTEYNVTVGFKDSNYLYKESTATFITGNIIDQGDFHILQGLIDDAYSSGVLNLPRSFEFTSKEDYPDVQIPDDWCMNITSPIIINGNGYTINALKYSRIFNITADNVVLNDINFVSGDAGGRYGDNVNKGGAIFWAGQNGEIKNSYVRYSFAEYGGGIYFNSTASNCNIVNLTFNVNNATKNGGAIDCNATNMHLYNTTFESNGAVNGAALCREVSATGGSGRNNTFISNHATNAGAALAWMMAENIYIDTYTFIDNTADYSGGAIYVGGGSDNCVIFNSTFTGNNVSNTTGGHGGAIEWYAAKGRILNSTFTNNHAYTGGAIYVGSGADEIFINQSEFLKNTAYYIGGAIDLVASKVEINTTLFRQNSALEGGAIFVGGVGENNLINNSYFTDNNATKGYGGAINWNASAGKVINTNFTRNSANYGGAMYLGGNSQNTEINGVVFTNNSAVYNGGALDWNSTGGKIYNNIFISNYAGEYGAALARESHSTQGGGKNNTFISNHADISGAALAWMAVANITIDDYKFYDNTANISGAAIFIGNHSDNCTILNSIFEGNNITNQTGGHGGAIDIVADNATVKNSNFTNNNAFYGGAIFVGSQSGNTNIIKSVFRDNNAVFDGGAINLQASGVILNETTFVWNIAKRFGGAVYVGGVGTTNRIYASNFTSNVAEMNGGAVYWRAYAGHIEDSNFTLNSAVNGGAIYLNGVSSNTNITHVIFDDNFALQNGGAIDCNSTRMNLTYTLFKNNYAGQYGAALCRETGATNGFGHHNNFTSNHAGIAGAALAWLNVKNINIDYYVFEDNIADQSGGAIYAAVGSDNFTINHCDFKGNNITGTASGDGGAISIASDNATIKNSNFTNNHAFDGGAIYVGSTTKGHTNITNVTFSKNGAYKDGGAVNIEASGVNLNDTRFYNNTALNNGGAVYVGGIGTSNVIYYSRFADNEANGHGGAIDWRASAGVMFHSNFIRNTAEYGGAIYLNGVSSGSKISEVYFAQNTALKNGGAIDCNATLMNLTNTLFVSNTAGEYGAALCRESGATGGFGGNNTFDKNHAGISGAALAWLDVDDIKINNYTFTNNTADYSGGAIYVSEGSDNCKVYNSIFKDNYISNAIDGRGGAIDWIGNNGAVENTTFTRCISVNAGGIYVGDHSHNMYIQNVTFTSCESLSNGGALVLEGQNVTIINSNFTSSVARDNGGAIAGLSSNDGNITNCLFKYNVVGGHIDPQGNVYGEGGAIYWQNSKNLTMINNSFETNAARLSGGSISANNVSDSLILNMSTHDETAFTDGGSIAWFNSNNVTIKSSFFNDSGSNYNGGTLYFENINATVKDTFINSTWASWGTGGAIYIAGNLTMDNITFSNTHSDENNATGIYFESGTSILSNSRFTNSFNSIGIQKGANVTLIKNNITADNPNKSMMYIKENTLYAASLVDYAVWNDGDLYLKENNFDYVIFNNGSIWTKTVSKMLNNASYEVEWNETFVFFANITDDNNNTIISVNSLKAKNDVYPDVSNYYVLPFNADEIRCIYQGIFHLIPEDEGLKNNTQYNGTLKVKMPVFVTVELFNLTKETIEIVAHLTPKYKSNYTINSTENLIFNIGNEQYVGKIIDNNETEGAFYTWTVANSTWIRNNLAAGTYTVTANYTGDDYHIGYLNQTTMVIELREVWIKVHADDVIYGGVATMVITSNATRGIVVVSVNGKYRGIVNLDNGQATYEIPNDMYGDLLDPDEYIVSVVYAGNENYSFAMNNTSFNVLKLNTTVGATPIASIEVGENEEITVIVNDNYEMKNATGFVKVTIGSEEYYKKLNETAEVKFIIPGLGKNTYTNVNVSYEGDRYFNGNSSLISFNVGQSDDYEITVHVDNITYGKNATIYIVLPICASQNLTVFVNNTEYDNVTVKDGLAIVNVNSSVLNNPGTYIVNVTYPGDSVYALKYNNGTKFNVAATDDWMLNLNVQAVTYGQNTIFAVTVPGDVATKLVNLTIDGRYYSVEINEDGVGTLILNNLSGGLHTVVANYTGDSRYVTKTNSTKFLVEKAASSTAITYDANGNVIATVTPVNVSGSVTFYVNGREYTVNLVGNVATLDKNNLTIGNNSIVAIYDGDINFTSSKDSRNITIAKNRAFVNVTAINVPYGSASEIIVKVPDVQKGYVTITVNDTLVNVTVKIVNGEGKFNVTGLDVGKYIVKVTYEGDENYAVQTNDTTFDVIQIDLNPTVLGVNVTYEMNSTFIIVVPDDYDGEVTITVDGETYRGSADLIIQMKKLTIGEKTAYVVFEDSKNYKGTERYVKFNVIDADNLLTVTTVVNSTTVVVTVPENVSGNIIVVLPNGTNKTCIVDNGSAIITLENMTPGENNITIIYNDGNNTITANATLTVPKYDSPMTATVSEAVAGGNATVTVEIPIGAIGSITVTIDNKKYTTDNISDGKASIIIENLTEGDKTLIVEYSGDTQYVANYTLANFTVAPGKAESEIIVVDHGNGTVVIIVGDNAEGNVTVKVSDNVYNATVINGTAVVNIGNETPGVHDVEVIYSGDDTHTNSTANATITAPKYDSYMNVTVSEVKEGEIAIITVKVPANATGNVTVYIDGKNYTATVKDGGIATVEVENITGGSKTVTVTYSGDENYIGDYTIYEFAVEKEKSAPNMIIEKDNNTVIVYVGDNATGNVTVKVGNETYTVNVVNGTSIVNLTNITPGIHDIEVIYSGDENHTNATINTSIDIPKHQTPIKISVDDINVGDKAIIAVEVADKATGTIIIEIDGQKYSKEIKNGVARFEVENLASGEKSVTALYEGDSNYALNVTTDQFKVSKVNSNLTVDIKDVKVGENVSVTVHVPNDATGQVLIDINGVGYYVNVTGGVGTVEIPYLSNGTYEVNLTYTGDEKYLSSTNKSSLTISKLESFVIPTASNIKVGENEIIKLKVPVGATGTVTVIIDGDEFAFDLRNGALGAAYIAGEKYIVAIAEGNGELIITGLSKGEYTVSVKYNGDDKYLPAVNTTIFTVSKQNASMNVVDEGNGTVKVILPDDAEGNVTLSDGENIYIVEVINGTASFNLKDTSPGLHDIEIKYNGDSNYSSKKINVKVDIPKYGTPISVEVQDINVGETETVTVTLPDGTTGTVTIEINGREYLTSDIANGKAIFAVDGLAFGNKTVAVKYSGDDKYCDNYTTGKFEVLKVSSTIKATGKDISVGKDETITVNVPGDATGRVLVNIDGVGYYGDVINGRAKIIIPELPSGKYTAEVVYEGDDKYLPSTSPVKFTVSKVSASISATGDEIKLGEDATVVVKVPSDATGTVTITIDGKKYTNEVKYGKAVFVIPGLSKGEYDVVASYSGDRKYDANDTITDVEVYFNETPTPEYEHEIGNGEGVRLSNYATANPILVLLLMLLAIGSSQLRRFKH